MALNQTGWCQQIEPEYQTVHHYEMPAQGRHLLPLPIDVSIAAKLATVLHILANRLGNYLTSQQCYPLLPSFRKQFYAPHLNWYYLQEYDQVVRVIHPIIKSLCISVSGSVDKQWFCFPNYDLNVFKSSIYYSLLGLYNLCRVPHIQTSQLLLLLLQPIRNCSIVA